MSRKNILVVDDDGKQREIFRRHLENAGFTVFQAEDCDGGIRIVDENDIHLALVDIVLAGKSGLVCLEFIRERYPDMKVIMMTGSIPREIAKDCLDMGADGLLEKPIRKDELVGSIKRVIFKAS